MAVKSAAKASEGVKQCPRQIGNRNTCSSKPEAGMRLCMRETLTKKSSDSNSVRNWVRRQDIMLLPSAGLCLLLVRVWNCNILTYHSAFMDFSSSHSHNCPKRKLGMYFYCYFTNEKTEAQCGYIVL